LYENIVNILVTIMNSMHNDIVTNHIINVYIVRIMKFNRL